MNEHPFIALYPDALPGVVCRRIIERFDADERRRAGQVEGLGNPKRSLDLAVGRLSGWEDLATTLNRAIVSAAVRYRDAHPSFARLYPDLRATGPQIQMYRAGGDDGFDWHADVVNAKTAERTLAVILYLNDVVEGGETEFQVQGLSVRPREGCVLWFPPSFAYLHRGRTPRSGAKYIVTAFLVGSR